MTDGKIFSALYLGKETNDFDTLWRKLNLSTLKSQSLANMIAFGYEELNEDFIKSFNEIMGLSRFATIKELTRDLNRYNGDYQDILYSILKLISNLFISKYTEPFELKSKISLLLSVLNFSYKIIDKYEQDSI